MKDKPRAAKGKPASNSVSWNCITGKHRLCFYAGWTHKAMIACICPCHKGS